VGGFGASGAKLGFAWRVARTDVYMSERNHKLHCTSGFWQRSELDMRLSSAYDMLYGEISGN
jgi:hypothetical protein